MSETMTDRKIWHGKYKGTKTRNAKLNDIKVVLIRELHEAGITTRQLGKAFGVHHTSIWQAVNYYTWNHLR